MKPFDLEAALKGAPVVLRNGRKAWVRHRETEIELKYSLIGFYESRFSQTIQSTSWTAQGSVFDDADQRGLDIVGMWEEPIIFEHWDLLDVDAYQIAKISVRVWWLYKTDSPCARMPVNYFAPGFFPDCPVGTVIERPKE